MPANPRCNTSRVSQYSLVALPPNRSESVILSEAKDLASPYRPKLRSADRAALYPHIPCTPPPGGVDAEQRNQPFTGMAYGSSARIGLASVCHRSFAPPTMSPPM